MDKITQQIELFKMLYPEYKDRTLDINLYCDILEDGEIIAVSNIPHDIDKAADRLATEWELVQRRKQGQKTLNSKA